MQLNEVLTNGSWSVLIPSEVFAETLNAVGKKVSRLDAIRVGCTMLTRYTAHDFDFIHAQSSTYTKALVLQENGSGSPSFVDCLVMALAMEYDTKYVFGFDGTFHKNGYLLPEDLTPSQAAA